MRLDWTRPYLLLLLLDVLSGNSANEITENSLL